MQHTEGIKNQPLNIFVACRILLKPGIHPLNPEECDVYTSLVEDAENSTIMAMLNHNVSPEGDVEGFRFTCCEKGMAACMPLSRKMFFRHSMIECKASPANSNALKLMMDQQGVKERLTR